MGSERGIAMIWWVIVLLVLFLASAGLAYDRYSFGEEQTRLLDKEKGENKKLSKRIRDEIEKQRVLSNVVGFKPDESSMLSSPLAISDAIEMYKEVFPDPGQDPAETTLQSMLTRAQQMRRTLARQLADETAAKKTARANENAARESSSTISRGKDSRISELEGEKQQVEDRLTNLTKTKDQEIEGLRGRVNVVIEEKTTLAAENKKKVKAIETERDRERNRAKDASDHYTSVKRNNGPDGMIIGRQEKGNRVFINLGVRHGLKEGTHFEVFDFVKGNKIRIKGSIVVQEVKSDLAIAALTNEVFEFEPVGQNDLIRNPLYQKGKKPKFFLMGDMTGSLSNQETERLIRVKGGVVAKKVTPDVDFIVVGRKESEDAQPFETRPEWDDARVYNIEFISSSYLIKYLTR